MDPIIIFVRGGAVDEVTGAHPYVLIDFDILEGDGMCPHCAEAIAGSACARCGIDWAVDDRRTIIEHITGAA